MARTRTLVLGLIAAATVVALAVDLSFSPANLPPANTNVYVVPQQSFCKGGATFSCTIVLGARQAGGAVPSVKSVIINGTDTQPTVTTTGTSVTIIATLPSISMARGLADVGPSQKPPSVGSVVIDLADETSVSVLLGPGGILQG